MLCFDIQALESRAAQVDGELSPDDAVWLESDARPAGPIRVTGRLSAAGPNRFYFHGHLAGTARGECRRCLTDVETVVALESHLVFSADHDDAEDADDAYQFDAGDRDLDLRPAVREEWLLNVPAFPLCREDCAGLCPRCGLDRNLSADAGGCRCEPEPGDTRWAALRAVSTKHTHDAAPGSGSSAE